MWPHLNIIIFRGERQYLVKWSGLDEDEKPWPGSWEPAENIEMDYAPLVEAFRQANKKTGSRSSKRLSNKKRN